MFFILIIIGILLPLIAGVLVYQMFQQDLQHSKSVRKLKRGATEELIERHRRAIIIHFAVFIIFSILSLIVFGTTAIIVAVVWLIVLLGHMQALSRFSKQMMGAMEMDRVIEARIANAPEEDDNFDEYEAEEMVNQQEG